MTPRELNREPLEYPRDLRRAPLLRPLSSSPSFAIYTLAGAYALSRRTQMRAPIVFAYFKLFRGRDAKWSVASAQWSDFPPVYLCRFFLFFFFICFSLSPFLFLSLSRSRKYADAHGATHRVIDTTNGAHRIAPRNALPRRSPTRERILNERAFPRAYVMDDS